MTSQESVKIGTVVEVKFGRNLVMGVVQAVEGVQVTAKSCMTGKAFTTSRIQRIVEQPAPQAEEPAAPAAEATAAPQAEEAAAPATDTVPAPQSDPATKIKEEDSAAEAKDDKPAAEDKEEPPPAAAEAGSAITEPAPQAEEPAAPQAKPLSLVKAALKVLGDEKRPMGCKELVEAIVARGLWKSPRGKTPAQTLYGTFCNEIRMKAAPRVKRTEAKGKFELA